MASVARAPADLAGEQVVVVCREGPRALSRQGTTWPPASVPEQGFLPMLYRSPHALRLARVAAARSTLAMETSWPGPVPKIL
jgi:hypothetical protein